jgi:Transmembrane family, TMEM144 of transporters
MAAITSMLAFGSFAAPIKSTLVVSLDVDPLVFQSYKTLMCFLTSWVVLLLGHEFTYSPWGIVSGLFWVPGGVATIIAVKFSGLAVGIGVASSFIVLVSFVWGIFVFKETVKSSHGACFAVFLMIFGIVGMSVYSAPDAPRQDYSRSHSYDENDNTSSSKDDSSNQNDCTSIAEGTRCNGRNDDHFEDELTGQFQTIVVSDNVHLNRDADFEICGFKLRRRTLGILAAVFNGTWGGSILVPMHWSG